MHLVQIFLPLYDNAGKALPRALFDAVRDELTEKFGGLTAHSRAPAEGLWKEAGDKTNHDDIVIYEVMADTLSKRWWRDYRRGLEQRFRQEQVVVRAQRIQML